MKRTLIVLAALLSSSFARAQGEGVETRVEYGELGSIELVGRGFAEEDLALLTRKMARSLLRAQLPTSRAGQPRVVVGEFRNETREGIDLDALGDRLTVALVQSNRFEVIDVEHRVAIAQELEYQRSSYVSPDGAHPRGRQAPVDFILSGSLKSIEQSAQPTSLVDYRLTLTLTDVESGVTRWAEEQGIRKRIELRGISTRTSFVWTAAGLATGAVTGLVGAGASVFSLAHVRPFDGFHFEGDDMRRVDDPARGPDPTSGLFGVGLLVAGAAIGIGTLLFVPPGNPAMDRLERTAP
jgi:uncharacterized protein (TIGR02722 family)